MNYHNQTYRIIAFFLAVLVFCTSTGISVDMHFCQGNFKSLSLIGKAKNCHELRQQKSSCKHHQALIQKINKCEGEEEKNCCHNQTLRFDLEQDQQLTIPDFSLSELDPHFNPAYIYLVQFEPLTLLNRIPHLYYRPPPLIRNIPVLIQSFLL